MNPPGLGFTSGWVDALLERGIQPMSTLHHWDLPAALDRLGGWLNPDSADWFADYARVLFRALDDRVKLWVTLNEPWVVVDGGYLHGVQWRPASATPMPRRSPRTIYCGRTPKRFKPIAPKAAIKSAWSSTWSRNIPPPKPPKI